MAIPLPRQIVFVPEHHQGIPPGKTPKDYITYDPDDFQGKAAYQNAVRWYIPLPTTIYKADSDPPPQPDRGIVRVEDISGANPPPHLEHAFLMVVTGDRGARWAAAWVQWQTSKAFNPADLIWDSGRPQKWGDAGTFDDLTIPAGLNTAANAVQRQNLGNFDLYLWHWYRVGIQGSEGEIEWTIPTGQPAHWTIASGSYLRVPR